MHAMRRFFLATLFLLACCAVQAQVPLRFTLRHSIDEQYKSSLPVRIVVVNPDGVADTLTNTTLRARSGSRNVDRRRPAGIQHNMPSEPFPRRYDRQLTMKGDYRLLLTVDTCTLELPFSLDGTELLVHAGVSIDWYDTAGTAYPAVRIYRPAPPEVKLYYLGVDTTKRKPLFNFVNRSKDTLYGGYHNLFKVVLMNYCDSLPPQFEHHTDYSYRIEAPLAPGRSRRLYSSYAASGRSSATLCYTTSPHSDHEVPGHSVYHGCIIYTRPDASVYWRDIRSDTWYIARCDLFLSSLDFR